MSLACAGKCESQKAHNEWVREALCEFLNDDYLPIHRQRHDGWYQRVGAPLSQVDSLFSKQDTFFCKQFGLAVWTSHVSVDEPEDYGLQGDGFGETTVAYLKLPNQQQRFAHWWPTSEERYGVFGEDIESGCGVRLNEARTLTDGEIRRFKRTVDILGLRPMVHETQVAEWNICTDKWEGFAVDCKPQLMALIRSSSE